MTEPVRGPETAGGLLRAAREKQGLHIAALAAAIKVTPRKLDALENNRWDELPDATFTRALAQTVCRSLKIDPRPVLDLLPALGPGTLENVAGSLNTPFSERGSQPSAFGGGVRPLVWAGGLLLLAAVVVVAVPSSFWSGLVNGDAMSTAQAPAFPASEAVGIPGPTEPFPAASPLPAWGAASEAPAPTTAEPAASASGSVGPASAALPATSATVAAAAVPASAPAAPAAAADSIQIRAVQSSWIEARDAQGRVLVSRLVAAGEQLVLQGDLPVRLVIGNAAGVELSFRQQRIDLPALTQDNVARLQLP